MTLFDGTANNRIRLPPRAWASWSDYLVLLESRKLWPSALFICGWSHGENTIETRNLRSSANFPEYLCDLVIHTPRGDLERIGCGLEQTVRNLLGTLLEDHEGKNSANADALLVGDCGEPGCCGVDFSVYHKGEEVELSWADPEELRNAVNQAIEEFPNRAIFPNEFTVGKIVSVVPRRRYVEAVLGFASTYLETRAARKDSDGQTRELFERVRAALSQDG